MADIVEQTQAEPGRNPDVARAVQAIAKKQKPYSKYWAYYDGKQELVYSSRRLRTIFQKIDARFNLNWCAVVVNSVVDRMEVAAFDVKGGKSVTDAANELWDNLELDLEQEDVYRCASVTGESFVIIGQKPSGDLEAYFNDSRWTEAFYDEEDPQAMSFAAKLWLDDGNRVRLILYYADRLEYYVSRNELKGRNMAGFDSRDLVEDPEYGAPENVFNPAIPVFHFTTQRCRAVSDLLNVIEPQDAASKLFADEMVAAEFGAFAQRYIISNAENLGELKNAPNEIWTIPFGDGGASVGQFAATQLNNFYDAIDKITHAIGIITSTPKHYFSPQAGDPSGEALIAMEAPLVKKVTKRGKLFASTWRAVMAALLTKSGQPTTLSDIKVIMEPAETVQPLTSAQIVGAEVGYGMPMKSALRRRGVKPNEIDDIMKDKAEEDAAKPTPPIDPLKQARDQAAAARAEARTGQGGPGAAGGVQ